MKKNLAFLLIICLLIVSLCACAKEQTVSDVTEKSIGSVVTINASKSFQTPFSYEELKSFSTGFLILGNYILTNAHCVLFDGASKLSVKDTTDLADEITCSFYNDKTAYPLEAVCYDAELDLAVLSFKNGCPAGKSPLLFANSDYVKYADTAIIIGNAKGYGISVTAGIISAPEREFVLPDDTTKVGIQTDASINQGNSGSPLLNINGAVIGIISFKIGELDESEGIGFAIPSNTIYDYLSENI